MKLWFDMDSQLILWVVIVLATPPVYTTTLHWKMEASGAIVPTVYCIPELAARMPRITEDAPKRINQYDIHVSNDIVDDGNAMPSRIILSAVHEHMPTAERS